MNKICPYCREEVRGNICKRCELFWGLDGSIFYGVNKLPYWKKVPKGILVVK